MVKKRPVPKVVDLSIDFDFFVREKYAWDWGHGDEGGQNVQWNQAMWDIRYASGLIHIYRATDPELYADFQPRLLPLITELTQRNIYFVPGKTGEFAYADSHSFAMGFFNSKVRRSVAERRQPDALVNIDAHHDCWPDKPSDPNDVHCGNWLSKLYRSWQGLLPQVVQVYPKWKPVTEDGSPAVPIQLEQFPTWKGLSEPHRVRHVYLCRSGGWVPPHLDPMYMTFLNQVGTFCGPTRAIAYGDLFARRHPSLADYNKTYLENFQDRATQLAITVEELKEKATNAYGRDSIWID